jgi:flagellin-like hook-associated protein FlgL
MGPAQDLVSLLPAMLEESVRNARVRLVLMGGGSEKGHVKEEIARLGLDNVSVLDAVPKSMAKAFIAQADAVLVHLKASPILDDTVPSKVQSYLASGTPILAGVGKEAEALVLASGGGITFAQSSAQSFATALNKLVAMGAGARSLAEETARACRRPRPKQLPGSEAYVGAPNAAQQAGLDLVAATQTGGAGTGPGSAELAAAYAAYATALVTSGGSLGAASAALPFGSNAQTSAAQTVVDLFRGTYAAANGNTLPGATVTVGSAATTAALAALGFASVPGAPGAPANPGGLNLVGLSLSSKAAALSSLASIDAALGTISSNRATLGAAGNRLQSAIANIQAFSESLSAANSRIRDVDVAEETSRMSRSQILLQAGVSVLAQANQQPQMALKLLG